MQKYRLGSKLGDGAFGSVVKGIDESTGRVVAIKHMKKHYKQWEECVSLNEVRILSRLHHPNIVGLVELIKSNNQLYFVFEYLQRNVYELLQERGKLPPLEVRNIMYQTLQALAYIHRKGYFHRDLKPENMLELNGTIKLADFGLARQIRAKPPFTEYVSTRWYRAPECLLRAPNYNWPMDIFALGAIMAELYTGVPLFPGSSEKDMLVKILQLLGTPSRAEWPEGYKLASQLSFEMPQFEGISLRAAIPGAPDQFLDLLGSLLQVAPQRRISAQQALQHNYFQVRNTEKPAQMSNKGHNQSGGGQWLKRVRYRAGSKCRL